MKTPLPIDGYIEDIKNTLQSSPSVIITAEPGTGKTTRLPPELLTSIVGKIFVLEPRRISAVAAANRIAEENQWQVGKEVGYQVRFDNKTSDSTRLVFMTEALLAKHIVKNPDLKNIGAIILDEFHERSLHVDLVLGIVKEQQDMGNPIKLIIMSATLESKAISKYLEEAPIIKIPGKLFPLKIEYHHASIRPLTDSVFFKEISSVIKAKGLSAKNDTLVFLPGLYEIRKIHEDLKLWAEAHNIEICSLHGGLQVEEQRSILNKGNRKRIILSTNIAESSLTIDGVDTVIDSGLSRQNFYNYKSGFSRLDLGRISLSSATQRAGRAARQHEGLCYRMWAKSDEASMPNTDTPEVLRSELSEALLLLSSLGITNFETFTWFDKPSPLAIHASTAHLLNLGAIDNEHKLTKDGHRMLSLPLSLRLAKLLLYAEQAGASYLGADIVSILQERDFIKDGISEYYIADELECDLSLRLHLLKEYRDKKRSNDVIPARVAHIIKVSEQIIRLVKTSKSDTYDVSLIPSLLLPTFFDRLCKRRKKSEKGRMLGGKGVKLEAKSVVRKSDLFFALIGREQAMNPEIMVPLASAVSKDLLSSRASIKEEFIYDDSKKKFLLRKVKHVQGLEIDEPTIEPANPEKINKQMTDVLLTNWDWLLKENSDLEHWWSRYQYFIKSKPLAEISNEKIKNAINMAAMGETDVNSVSKKNLVYFLELEMDASDALALKTKVPQKIKVPSGSHIKVIYPKDKAPFLEVRIQEIFGLEDGPKIGLDQQPIVLHLLAPNYRPAQVTSDLKSFWKNAYPEIRKDLRLRYPKHSWPEDPLQAIAVAKGKPSRR